MVTTNLDQPWLGEYRNPAHANIMHKPMVDVGRPHSNARQTDWSMRHGAGPGWMMHSSMNHFIMTPEAAPYTSSYSTRDACVFWWYLLNIVYVNWFIGRVTVGSLNARSPHTRWAHSIVFWSGLFRVQLAWLIGACGMFYSYEFMYTSVPYLKIKDPSPEGWKKPWQEGQSTYIARQISGIFPILGYAAWKGGFKRCYLWFGFCQGTLLTLEIGRTMVHPGTIMTLGFLNYLENDKFARYGSLMPELERRINPDTNRPLWAEQYEYFRISHSDIIPQLWKHGGPDYIPGREQNIKMRNPWYNWQKAAQGDNTAPVRYKNQLFEMPSVLTAHVISGASD
jgi:hypothetical protein